MSNRCSFKSKVQILPPSAIDNQRSFLVPLSYQKPKNIFCYPLYLLRSFNNVAKVLESEVEGILWEKTSEGWRVKLREGVYINGLKNIENFICLKKLYFSLKA